MALMDQNMVLSSAQAITATAQSTNAYDIANGGTLAVASGAYTSNYIQGNATVFGEDLGLGRGVGTPAIEVFSGSGTPAGATSLDIQLQGAVDPGTGNTSGCTYVAYLGTEPIPLASILASNRLAAWKLLAEQLQRMRTAADLARKNARELKRRQNAQRPRGVKKQFVELKRRRARTRHARKDMGQEE